MPESLEAEAGVLGSMILDGQCIGAVVQSVESKNFYRKENQLIFDAIVKLYEDNKDIDLVLLRDQLTKEGLLEEVGGVDYLVKVVNSVPSAANAEYYCDIVKEKSVMRELIKASSEIMELSYEQSGDIADKLDQAEKLIFEVTEKRISAQAETIKGLLLNVFDTIEHRKQKGLEGGLLGMPTGFYELDEKLCGLQKSDMIIIAGRPSMGKTSFAMNIAEHLGADNDLPVAIFSLEMSKELLAEKLLCSRSKISLQKVRKGLINVDEHKELTHVGSELFEKPIYIDDTPNLSPLEIRAKCRRLKSQYDIQAVFVDYLQLMSSGFRVESRQQEVSTISRYLKALAKELNVPVLVLSQLNRSPEQREGHRPRMSDLRESGSIEQDADVIMLLHREAYYNQETNKDLGEADEGDYDSDVQGDDANTAEVIIAKQRNGPTGTIKLYFDGRYTRFENLSRVNDPF
jgi:replicative DNA helicase